MKFKNYNSNKNILITNKQLLYAYKKTGDLKIRNEIIINNMGLIYTIAKKRLNTHTSFTFEDLVQEGIIGMIKGIEKFDIQRKTRFSTYVYYWINQQIDRAIMNKGYLIRLPAYVYEKITTLNNIEFLYQDVNNDLNFIMEKTNISENEYDSLDYYRNNYCSFYSLNTLINIDNENSYVEFQDLIPSEEPSLEEDIIKKELKNQINNTLNILTPKEKDIIELRFGLKGGEAKTLEEIGKKYNVTRERIRQIEAKAFKKIRALKDKEFLKKYLDYL